MGNWYIFAREAILSKLFLPLSGKESTTKGKNLLPFGSKFFLLRVDPFSEGVDVQENKHEVTKVVSPVKHGRKSTECNQSP